jgi:tetratricopeptide (TPR) repeat protein
MKNFLTFILVAGTVAIGLGGCDLLDSSNVENPELTQEAALNNPDPLQQWVSGLERQMALVINGTVDFTSIATDNYRNTETFYNQNADALEFDIADDDIDLMFFRMNDLRESALFGKTEVLLADDSPRARDEAELDFYLGMAHLFLGEHFLNAPAEGNGTPASPEAHFNLAVDALEAALSSGNGDLTAYKLALARTYYNLGNATEATRLANEVLTEDADFVRFTEFDNQNGPVNVMQNALYDRSTLDDFQPLPRLDFLDPKFGEEGPAETPFPLLKAEEAHFILIENDLAAGTLADAKTQMQGLLDLVQERGLRVIDESTEGRRQEAPEATNPSGFRPDTSVVEVRASQEDPYREGLVLNRNESTMVASISGTSVTESIIDDVSTAQEAWELYYLLRQEVFMAEGRRFVDFGLKLPLPENELLVNENIDRATAEDQVIPSYMPSNPTQLDAFTYDIENFQATVAVNMNRVLANNRNSVSPFLQ